MKRLRILFSVVIIMVFTVPFTYAAQQTMEDGQISIDIPKGWEYTNSEHYSKEMAKVYDWQDQEDAYESLRATNRVLLGQKDFVQGSSYYLGVLEILYHLDSEGRSDYDTYADSELKEQGKQNLEQVIMNLLPTVDAEDGLTWSEPKIVEGEWGPFIHSDVQVNQDEHTSYYSLYYTVKEGVQVSFVFSSYGDGLTEAQKTDVETMVKSFEDSGYYMDFAESEESYNSDEGFDYYEDGDTWLEILIPIIVVAIGAGIAAVTKASGGKAGIFKEKLESGRQKAQEVINLNQTKEKPAKQSSEQSVKADDQAIQVRASNPAAGVKAGDQSYLNSLKTLLDSGLVTKDEYNDLIKKHNNRT